MLYRGLLGDSDVTLSLQPHWLTLGFDERLVVSWDRAGRLYSLYRDEHTFRRGFNGRVLEKWQDADGERHWDTLETADAHALADDAARLAARVHEALPTPRWSWQGDTPGERLGELVAALASAAAFTGAASARDAARFAEIYSTVGILPPDQYLSIVVQATEGCSFNTCTFCALYGGRYRVKSVEEFEPHLDAVRTWLGPSAGLRDRGLFLGAANALAVPMARLVPAFDAIGRVFPDARGVSAFVDGFTGLRKTAGDYHELAARGLRRVYVGLESGHDALLAFVEKPATRAEAVATVRALREAGVRVGVIVMIGLGGHAYAGAHVEDTITALHDMALGEHDLLYFSDLVEEPGTSYPALASARRIRPLIATERRAQRHAITDGLRRRAGDRSLPRMATYDVREFVY
ncbi:MAG: radical SAM protein [Vicinamibacteraceae bacterium]|nr:radical SAM protein [Vicinamibacteraceae bacterium]